MTAEVQIDETCIDCGAVQLVLYTKAHQEDAEDLGFDWLAQEGDTVLCSGCTAQHIIVIDDDGYASVQAAN